MMPIRWGFIGCGEVAEQKSGPAFYKSAGSTVKAVMSRNAEKAKDFAYRHGIDRYYDRAADLIQDEEVDAVYIATPPASHMPMALACADANKPVYLEKPMARSYGECLTILQAFEEKQLPLFVAYYRRALPKMKQVKQLIDEGRIGTIRSFQVTLHKPMPVSSQDPLPWRLKPEIAGGGLFVDLAGHTIDLIEHLLGPVEAVSGMATNQTGISEAEDMVCAQFQLPNHILGSSQWCFSTDQREDAITITGGNGHIIFSNHGKEPILLINQHGRQTFAYETPEHIEQLFIEQVVKSLATNEPGLGNGNEAAKVNWVMDEVLKGYYGEQ